MIIAEYSDVHKEFGNPFEPNCDGVDVLLFAGDSGVGTMGISWAHDLLGKYPKLHIVYVNGNHEYYGKDLDKLDETIREFAQNHARLHFLQNDSVVIDGYRFIGSTLWSSFNNGDPLAMYDAESVMNDYKKIRYNHYNSRLTAKELLRRHRQSVEYVFNEIANSEEPTIVVTHNKPYLGSIRDLIGYAYESDLTKNFDALKKTPKIWFYGHTHALDDTVIEYEHGDVRFVANCVGYYGHEYTCFDENLRIEI